MTAELGKLLHLPTPRWTLAATVAAAALAALAAALANPGGERDILLVGVGLGTSIAAIVLAAWMIGVEYGQQTIRRALTADPSRARMLLRKLFAVFGAVAAATVILFAVSAPLFSASASAHCESMPTSETLEYGVAALLSNLVYATASFALALATRSMAGGMALALCFAFVIDTALAAIPAVGDYTLGAAVLELMSEIHGEDLAGLPADDPNIARAVAVAFIWVIALVGVSFARFIRSDIE